MHWPDGFVEERLVSRSRLLRHGVSFENAVCNTAMCSPSRATFLTGVMPAQHGMVDTLTADGRFSRTETELSRNIPNLASMLGAGRYEVQYRGKWHLSKGPSGGYDATPEDLAAYGFDGWVAPAVEPCCQDLREMRISPAAAGCPPRFVKPQCELRRRQAPPDA